MSAQRRPETDQCSERSETARNGPISSQRRLGSDQSEHRGGWKLTNDHLEAADNCPIRTNKKADGFNEWSKSSSLQDDDGKVEVGLHSGNLMLPRELVKESVWRTNIRQSYRAFAKQSNSDLMFHRN